MREGRVGCVGVRGAGDDLPVTNRAIRFDRCADDIREMRAVATDSAVQSAMHVQKSIGNECCVMRARPWQRLECEPFSDGAIRADFGGEDAGFSFLFTL